MDAADTSRKSSVDVNAAAAIAAEPVISGSDQELNAIPRDPDRDDARAQQEALQQYLIGLGRARCVDGRPT